MTHREDLHSLQCYQSDLPLGHLGYPFSSVLPKATFHWGIYGSSTSQTCTILGATGKVTTKRFTRALLCCWDGQIFSHQFLVVPECPTPLLGRDILTKLGTTLVIGSFSAPRALQLLVTTKEPITPSIERDQKLWEDKINPQM